MSFPPLTPDRKRIAIAALLLAIIGGAGYSIVAALSTHPDFRAAQEAEKRRDFDAAASHLQKYLQENPAAQAGWLLAAKAARRQGRLAEAAEYLDAYTRLAGQRAEGELEKRLIRVQSGSVEEADTLRAKYPAQEPAILEAVIEGHLKRLFVGMRHELEETGQSEINMADYARAHEAVDQWLDSCPDRVDQVQGYVWRGKLFAIAKEYPKALAAFRTALEFDPDHRAARENLGLLLVADAPQEAAKHLQRARSQDSGNIVIAYNLAVAQRAMGDHDQARKLLDDLLANHPNDPTLLVERALVALDERRPREAEVALQRALRVQPNHAQANLVYSQCLQQAGRTADAKQYHDKYLEIQAQSKRQNDAKKKI